MQISNFKVGDNLWRVDFDKKTGTASYTPFPISKVGRKYVYVQHGPWETRFQMYIDGNYFIDTKDWGTPETLYFSEQDARDRVERRDCEDFIARLDHWNLRNCNLAALREAVKIIKGGMSNGNV